MAKKVIKKVRTGKFVVEFELPDGVSIADAKDYVIDAVKTMSGSYDVIDLAFELGKDATVKSFRKPRAV